MIQLKMESNATEYRKAIRETNVTKAGQQRTINKTDKPLSRLVRDKERDISPTQTARTEVNISTIIHTSK